MKSSFWLFIEFGFSVYSVKVSPQLILNALLHKSIDMVCFLLVLIDFLKIVHINKTHNLFLLNLLDVYDLLYLTDILDVWNVLDLLNRLSIQQTKLM